MRTKKLVTSGIAVALAGALLFGGTFAWQSISQTALNEVTASVNPGGRLHDDFNNITATVEPTDGEPVTMTFDKDVYVENFTELANNGVQVFARVRLDEYMELGTGAGLLNEDGTASEKNQAVSLVPGATLDDKNSWTTHLFGTETDATNPFHQYWNWDMGGQTTYMPTFNKNKDSLEADINGTSRDNFATYVDYSLDENEEKTLNAIYDADAAEEGQKEVDEIVQANLTASQFINAADDDALNALKGQIANVDDYIKVVESETHTVQQTLNGAVISMDAYNQALKDGELVLDEETTIENFTGTGNFWVYDTDGWAYWANPIDPATATGLLLDGISRTEKIINQDWYYAINVVAQFITYDDMGQDDNTGFYDIEQGAYPSADALTLLKTIGVDVPTHDVASVEALTAALAQGGIVNVTGNIELSAPLTASASCVLNLNGKTISGTNLWDKSEKNWSLLSVRNGATVVINDGTFAAAENDSYAVDVRDGSKVIINGGEFKGNMNCVYVLKGEAVINGGTFSVQQTSGVPGAEYDYVLNCKDDNYANGTAKITVCGGTFEKFDPSNCKAEGAGTNFVADGYTSTPSGTTYTVTKNTVSTGE